MFSNLAIALSAMVLVRVRHSRAGSDNQASAVDAQQTAASVRIKNIEEACEYGVSQKPDPPHGIRSQQGAVQPAAEYQDRRMPEDCGYCSQSSHHDAGLQASKLMDPARVIEEAKAAAAAGATR
jgi:hypothetical protein